MKTLIVPTDFSPVSLNAVNYAADMAMSIDASLILLNVYQIPVTFSELPVVNISIEEIKKISELKIEELKKGLEHVSSGKLKIYGESRMGDVVDEIESFSKKISPFAVVMGTKGASGLERLFLGSSTLTAIRQLNFPVIVVPPGAIFSGIKNLGFACDLNEVVETTPGDLIHSVCNTFNAKLQVLNVDYKNRHFKPVTPEESILLHTMLEDLNPVYQYIDHPDVAEGINMFAETQGVDMIITIPKKHKLLSGLFQKSHTKDLVFHAHIPIMCIHE
ncbi:MAG: universal stress protein [Chitinophagaceae bacterium]